jgi:hypothetical protein
MLYIVSVAASSQNIMLINNVWLYSIPLYDSTAVYAFSYWKSCRCPGFATINGFSECSYISSCTVS